MKNVDVLVVGGGPAGATAGKFLTEKGFNVLLVQRNCDYRKPCGGGVRNEAFSKFGLDTNIAEKKVNEINIFFKEKKISINIEETPIYIVDRKKFDKYLRQKAKEKGCSVLEGSVTDFNLYNDYQISTVKTKYEILKVKSRYIVSADGVNSIFRKKLFGSYGKRIPVSYIDIPDMKTDTCSFYFGKEIAYRYYGWVFPHFEGVNIGTYKGKLENFLSYLGIKTDIKPKGYFIPLWENPVFYKNRVFFAGDSASQVMPFTFEGIYFAMEGGFLVSEAIEKGNPSLYQEMWNKRFFNQFSSLRKLQDLFLYNNFTISLLIRLFENPYIQREMIKLWLGKREVNVDFSLFIRLARRIIFKNFHF